MRELILGPFGHTSMTPLHKHAWWSLVIGSAISLAMVALLLIQGTTSTFEGGWATGLPIAGLFAGALVADAIWLTRVRRKMDERDREIMNRAPAMRSAAILVTVAAWSIVLTHAYQDEGSVPVFFPNLIFFSTFMVSILARSVGVLMGYAGWSGWSGAEG